MISTLNWFLIIGGCADFSSNKTFVQGVTAQQLLFVVKGNTNGVQIYPVTDAASTAIGTWVVHGASELSLSDQTGGGSAAGRLRSSSYLDVYCYNADNQLTLSMP